MIKLLNKNVGKLLLEYIAEEVTAHSALLQTIKTRGDDVFDEVAYRSKHIANIDNDLKISICEKIGDVLVDEDILR